MRSSLTVWTLCAGLTIAMACSGSSSTEKADEAPTEESAAAVSEESAEGASEEATGEETGAEEEAPAEEPAEANLDLENMTKADAEALISISGNADAEQVKGVIGQRKPDVYNCYKKELPNSPGLSGIVLMQITTTPTGEVAAAMVKQSSLGNRTVEQCMVSKIREWKFPEDASGSLTVITYPFVLPP